MRLRHLSARARPLLVASGLTLIVAALLIAYLQRRQEAEQQAQTKSKIISQQICERTAAHLASRLRQEFESAFVETIEGIDHYKLRDAHLPTIAPALAAGLERHAYVERFFFWNERLPAPFRDQVLFYNPNLGPGDSDVAVVDENGKSLGGFEAMAPLGRELLSMAHASRSQALIPRDRQVDGSPYQIVTHLYGTDRWPEDVPGIIGFTVNLDTLGRTVLAEMMMSEFTRLMPQSPDVPRYKLNVVDETGEEVLGERAASGTPTGRASIDLAFHPTLPWNLARERARKVPKVPTWDVFVSAPPSADGFMTQDYLFAAVLLLILIAFACAALLNRQSERLSMLHADFVANVTHQLKTPLSLLAAASETLEHERVKTPEKVRDYAALVGHQTEALTRLVERILMLSRIDAATDAYDFQPVELVQLVEGTVERFGESFSNRPGALSFEGSAQEVLVEGDPAALEEAVVNLIDNAAKYTNGNGTVRVRVDGNDREASVSIADDGVGIERADLPHVFEKFYRGRKNGSVRGFGVGLSIVEHIVHAHNGRINVESELGRGSEFRIVFPTAPANGPTGNVSR